MAPPAQVPPTDPLLGRTIGQRYRLISRLGAGSAASVYLARHVLIERLSAIKIVHPDLARDPMWRERFLREARAVNRINHPNIVEISDLGEADGLLFLVMEYIPGESLQRILERGRMGWQRAAQIGHEVAGALGRAHQMGVVHRGLDSSNVLVVQRREGVDVVKLTDFGVAKLSDAAPLTMRVPRIEGVQNLRDLDARSDLFDLGALLYQATTGKAPPHGGIPGGFDPTLIAEAPTYFAEVVATLLAPDPEDRPRDGFEAADLLARAISMGNPAAGVSHAPPNFSTGAPSARNSSVPPPSRRDPRSGIRSATVEELAGLCASRLARAEETLAELLDVGHLPEPTLDALGEARRQVATVSVLAELCESDKRTLEGIHMRGRAARAELGRRLDEVAREHSKTLGWAGTIAERSYQVEAQRLSGDLPVPAVEAMVWEQAALEQEEDSAREGAARIEAEMQAQRTEIDLHHERHGQELRVANACVEGRIAALRTVAAEAWSALAELESACGTST